MASVLIIHTGKLSYSLAAAGPSAAQIFRPKKKETGVTDSVKANLILGGVKMNLAMTLCASAIVAVKDGDLCVALNFFHLKRYLLTIKSKSQLLWCFIGGNSRANADIILYFQCFF